MRDVIAAKRQKEQESHDDLIATRARLEEDIARSLDRLRLYDDLLALAPVVANGHLKRRGTGKTNQKIVAELLRNAPNNMLHIDQIMQKASEAGHEITRGTLQSLMSREPTFISVEAGSGYWTLAPDDEVSEEEVRGIGDVSVGISAGNTA